ncbi:MAG: hypothetical protein ACHQPI_11230 [Thermoanaerobaculia bacterium]
MAETKGHGSPGPPEGRVDREINVPAVRRFALFVIGLMAFTLVLIWGITRLVKQELVKQDPAPPPLEAARENPLPPEPRLEGPPGPLLQALRTREDAVLTTWGWADKAKGIAVIPIDRAVEIAAEKGLPIRYGPTPADAQGVRGTPEGKSPGKRNPAPTRAGGAAK